MVKLEKKNGRVTGVIARDVQGARHYLRINASKGVILSTGGYGNNNLAQWGMQAMPNACQKTSDAISKAIKKNKVKLKYGTFVYLVNGRENRN